MRDSRIIFLLVALSAASGCVTQRISSVQTQRNPSAIPQEALIRFMDSLASQTTSDRATFEAMFLDSINRESDGLAIHVHGIDDLRSIPLSDQLSLVRKLSADSLLKNALHVSDDAVHTAASEAVTAAQEPRAPRSFAVSDLRAGGNLSAAEISRENVRNTIIKDAREFQLPIGQNTVMSIIEVPNKNPVGVLVWTRGSSEGARVFVVTRPTHRMPEIGYEVALDVTRSGVMYDDVLGATFSDLFLGRGPEPVKSLLSTLEQNGSAFNVINTPSP